MTKIELKIPNNNETEQRALGACFHSTNSANFILNELTASDFFNPYNALIFNVLRDLYVTGASVNYDVFHNYALKNDLYKKCGSIVYVHTIAYSCTDTDNDAYYCNQLRELRLKRELLVLGEDIPKLACDGKIEAESLIGDLQTRLYKLQGIEPMSVQSSRDLSDTFSEHGSFKDSLIWRIEQAKQGLPTFMGISSLYPQLDALFGFFRPGALYYIGARTSMGKTTFLLNLINNFLYQKIPVGFFSLEMPSRSVYGKLVCIRADIRYDLFDEGHISSFNKQTLEDADEQINLSPLFIDDQEGLTISQLRARARRMQLTHEIKVLCIDYLTLIKPDFRHTNKHADVDTVSKGLQNLAKELKVPILCLAQLNRASDTSRGPSLTDFRESGSIEEDADGCIFLHRPDYYEPTAMPGYVKVCVKKNRVRGTIKDILFEKCKHSERYFESKAIEEELKRSEGV